MSLIDSVSLFGDESNDPEFSLPASARSSLSSLLIVHPIAAFLTLICLALAASAHLHSPSHSPRYLLALLILLLPTLLITLLAFLVDILLFVPHLAWGGWIVLGSTILITASGIVTCAMRRLLVSRKARKKRIAENPEMNGQSYYSQQTTVQADSPPSFRASLAQPMANGQPGPDHLPAFAAFDQKTPQAHDEERIPLNTRTPSNRTVPSNGNRVFATEEVFSRYGGPGRPSPGPGPGPGPGGMRGGRSGHYIGPRDEFGNPLSTSNAFGPDGFRREPSERGMMHHYSSETVNSIGSRGRGRGGYPSRGYGRGGHLGPGRGPLMAGDGRGMGRGSMPGENAFVMSGWRHEGSAPNDGRNYGLQNRGEFRESDHQMPMGSNIAIADRNPSLQRYDRRPSYGSPVSPGASGKQPSLPFPLAPGANDREPLPESSSGPVAYGFGRSNSTPGPIEPHYGGAPAPPVMPDLPPNRSEIIGQAIEMDASTGSPSRAPTVRHPIPPGNNENNLQELSEFQQQHRQSPMSLTSNYSSQE